VPGVWEVDMDAGQTPGRNALAQNLNGVVLDDAQVSKSSLPDGLKQ